MMKRRLQLQCSTMLNIAWRSVSSRARSARSSVSIAAPAQTAGPPSEGATWTPWPLARSSTRSSSMTKTKRSDERTRPSPKPIWRSTESVKSPGATLSLSPVDWHESRHSVPMMPPRSPSSLKRVRASVRSVVGKAVVKSTKSTHVPSLAPARERSVSITSQSWCRTSRPRLPVAWRSANGFSISIQTRRRSKMARSKSLEICDTRTTPR
mmetsp:Transcript_21432/g.72621  ORF Transcript_21432/g.72621 Transcript_21432/m.72621 type:complete len:210 (+) Transcript_21432:1027-1656(+)